MSIGKRDPASVQANAEDYRDSQRQRQYKSAKLVFNEDQSVVDCVLRDLSATGARVKVGVMIDVPDEVILKISNGVSYSADVMWHRGEELGLHFHGEAKLEITGKVSSVRSVLDMTKALPMDRLLRALETYSDFSDDDVKYAGQELGTAYEVLIETLRTLLHNEEKKFAEEGE